MTSKIIKKFIEDHKGDELTKQEGNFSSLIFGLLSSCFEIDLMYKYYPGKDFGSLVFLSKGKHGICFFNLNSYRGCTEDTLKKYIFNREKFTEPEDWEEFKKEVDLLYKEYSPERLKEPSNQELEDLIKRFFELQRKWLVITIFSEAFDETIGKRYFDEFNEQDIDFNEFYNTASLVDFKSLILEKDKILLNYKGSNPYDIQWLFGSYFVTPGIEECEKLIKEEVKKIRLDKLKDEEKKLEEKIDQNKSEIDKFRKKLHGKLKDLFDFVKFTTKLRDTRKECSFKCTTLICNAVREMFKRLKVSGKYLPHITIYDFSDGTYKRKDYEDILKKRSKGMAMYYDKKEHILEYVDFDEFNNEIFNLIHPEQSSEIKGQVAYKGLCKGKVNVVLNTNDFKKFKSGDILVTSMTRPEFVPLMKKAAAVVTDEGGISCHAAIVSRELGIPCIVGTKNATRVLKDGMEVEVNADAGTVRILK